jgi:hypothetical protein
MSRTLYQIEADERALSDLMESLGGDITGHEEAYERITKELAEDRNLKLQGYGKRIRNLEAEARRLKAEASVFMEEANRLLKCAESRTKDAEAAKRRLKEYMERAGETRIGQPPFEFAILGVGGQQKVTYLVKPENLPEGLRRKVETWAPDDAAVRAAAGEDGLVRNPDGVAVARIEPKASRLDMR